MTQKEALKVLVKMRAWRRWGKEQKEEERPEMPEQKEVDEAFDVCIEMFSKPFLPSNLDEAARIYSERTRFHWPNQVKPAYDAFKAGAEWMAEQGETLPGIVTKISDKFDVETTEYIIPEKSEFDRGDKIVVQIRKQQ